MPILDLGYRSWEGGRTVRWMRWLAIARASATVALRDSWVRRVLTFGWMPAIITLAGLFIFEQSLKNQGPREFVARMAQNLWQNPKLASLVRADPELVRQEVWAMMLSTFFRYPQSVVMVIMFGLVAPRLISFDLKSRAYLLYFSRPMNPLEYLLGKASVLWCLIALLTMVPALLLYACGLMISSDTASISLTWSLPLRIVAATMILAVPTSAIALLFSSLTTESRYAAFSWYAMWILGWIIYGILSSELLAGPPDEMGAETVQHRIVTSLRWLSPYHTLGYLQVWAFGVQPIYRPCGM